MSLTEESCDSSEMVATSPWEVRSRRGGTAQQSTQCLTPCQLEGYPRAMATVTRRDPSRRAAVEASVLAATEALLAAGRSFAELPVEEIARRAGMSRPAFYFYFRDKS